MEQSSNNFEKFSKDIRSIASYLSYRYHHRFDTDELINEAWIQNHELNLPSKYQVLKRTRWNMMDYMRKEDGRDILINGEKVPRPKPITNIDTFFPLSEDEEGNSVLDGYYIDHDLKVAENKEFLHSLFSKLLTSEQRQAISL
jgi:hypothetical protein